MNYFKCNVCGIELSAYQFERFVSKQKRLNQPHFLMKNGQQCGGLFSEYREIKPYGIKERHEYIDAANDSGFVTCNDKGKVIL